MKATAASVNSTPPIYQGTRLRWFSGSSSEITLTRMMPARNEVIAAINDELTEMTVAYGSKLRREAKLALSAEISGEELT